MGGKGSGGRRVGAGRKPRANILTFPGSGSSASAGIGAAPTPVPVDPPEDLLPEERRIWDDLAPLALQAGTLSPVTRQSFMDLVRARIKRELCAAMLDADGWVIVVEGEIKKHPLEVALRGWELRVEAGMARFNLAPFGKPVAALAKSADPFAEFEAKG